MHEQRPRIRRRRWILRTGQFLACLVAVYVLFLSAGFVPVNLGNARPEVGEGVRIFVRSNEIHTDLVLPVVDDASGQDWRERFPPRDFARDVGSDLWVAFGWGNRSFFVETPTWDEFKLSTACRALLWPSESVLHVEYLYDVADGPNMRELVISRDDYRKLVAFIESTVADRDERGAAQTVTPVTYGSSDRFYASTGRYHAFNTCNQWTGRGLATAGVPVGIWTPLKVHVLYWLPDQPALGAEQAM